MSRKKSSLSLCAGCAESLKEEAVVAMEKLWHPDHFICTDCKNPIKQTFQENQGDPFCVPCYTERFNPKCAGCFRTLIDSCVTAMEKQWHKECFVCSECKDPFPDGEFYLIDSQPYDLDCHWGKRLEQYVNRSG